MVQSFGTPTLQKDQRVTLTLADATSGSPQVVGGKPLVFDLNPEDLSAQHPSRVTTVNTIAGAYQDNWGPGVGRLSISGTTGWRKKTADGRDGFELFVALRELHRQYQNLCAENDPDKVVLTILLPPGTYQNPQVAQLISTLGAITNLFAPVALPQSFTQNQYGYYRISSDNFTAQRSVSQSLLFRYQWDFTILRDLLQGQIVDPSRRFIILPGDYASSDPFQSPSLSGSGSGTGATTSSGGSGSTATNQPPPGTTAVQGPGPGGVAGTPVDTGVSQLDPAKLAAGKAALTLDAAQQFDAPQLVSADGGSPFGYYLGSQHDGGNNPTFEELQVYNALVTGHLYNRSDVPPKGTKIFVPDAVWVAAYRQQLAHPQPAPTGN